MPHWLYYIYYLKSVFILYFIDTKPEAKRRECELAGVHVFKETPTNSSRVRKPSHKCMEIDGDNDDDRYKNKKCNVKTAEKTLMKIQNKKLPNN